MYRCLISFTILSLTIGGCAAPGKRFARLNEALALSPSTEQGRAALEEGCKDGLSAACGFLGAAVEVEKPAAIIQGQTSSTQTRFAVLPADGRAVTYYMRAGVAITKLNSERVNDVDHVEAFSLDPKQNYELLLVDNDAHLLDRRAFHTLNTDRQRARILMLSGADPLASAESAKIWADIGAQKPDAIFLLGNHVMGADLNAHKETRRKLPLAALNPLIPVLAIWNDRDYGKSNGDRTYSGKVAALEAFQTYFPQKKPASQFESGPGNSFWWNVFGASFVFLDNRSGRSPDGVDLPDQSHFGEEQNKWLNGRLALGKDPVILLSGDPFFSAGREVASFEASHPKAFEAQLKEWSAIKTPIVFFSGNKGLSEIYEVPKERLGYKTFEVSSSPLQGKPEASNYVVFELMRSERNLLRFHVQSFGLGAKLLFQKTLMVKR